MLDERDLEAIEKLVTKSIDERVTKSESMILSEIECMGTQKGIWNG
ncbi:MAG: hypothetical protein J6C19_11215 [Lachnospiraceae bacterium]|nr:hypothetical protein [Lachnospiraceae bacterium]